MCFLIVLNRKLFCRAASHTAEITSAGLEKTKGMIQMKNQNTKNGTYRITIELNPDDYAGLERMAAMLGSTVARAAEALLLDTPGSYLDREGDPIWESVVDYVETRDGQTPHLRLLLRFLQERSSYPHTEDGRLVGPAPFWVRFKTLETFKAHLGSE